MARKESFTKEEVITAIKEAQGFITKASQILGCHPNTVRNYARRYEEVQQALELAREEMLDLAEMKLLELIEKGDFRAIKFYLLTQGKHRGYTYKQEVNFSPIGEDELPEWFIDLERSINR